LFAEKEIQMIELIDAQAQEAVIKVIGSAVAR